jgi:hypothetical protein
MRELTMPRIASVAAVTAAICLSSFANAWALDWQVDAKYCWGDTNGPGQAYRAACKDHDQFDSILACEKAAGDENAGERIRMAGRDDVNAYMMGFGAVDGCQ